MLATRLGWLGMDILWGEEVFCSLHPQGQSYSAGQRHRWLFSAIVIYSSTQPKPAETHYPYSHVLFCSPLGSCTHTNILYTPLHMQNETHKLACAEQKLYTPVHVGQSCVLMTIHMHTYTCICKKKPPPLSVVSTRAHLWREWYLWYISSHALSHVLAFYSCWWSTRTKMSIAMIFLGAVLWG